MPAVNPYGARIASVTGSRVPARRPVEATRPTQNPLAGILTNPGVFQGSLDRDRLIAEANAALRQARSQALINFGDPNLARSLGDTVDPNTAAAAQANQFSTVARLGRDDVNARRRLMNNLAGRGLLHSGETGYQQGQQALRYGEGLYSAQQQLLSQLNQFLSAYMGETQGAQDAYTQALLQAFAQLGRNPLGLAT